MKKKNINTAVMVGMIFAFIGGLFLIFGIVFMALIDRVHVDSNSTGDITILPIIFTSIGFAIFAVGVLCFAFAYLKKKRIQRLIESGNYVYATIKDVSVNFNVSIYGKHPYILECHYEDPYTSETHVYRSGNIMFNPKHLLDTEIRVWVDKDDYSLYYVDVESISSNVVVH